MYVCSVQKTGTKKSHASVPLRGEYSENRLGKAKVGNVEGTGYI
jgi:hypothetical protein